MSEPSLGGKSKSVIPNIKSKIGALAANDGDTEMMEERS